MSKVEDSISNIQVLSDDEIQPVNNEESMAAEDDERVQLLLNISLDRIDSGHSLNSEDSFSSSSSAYQMTLLEKFNYIATLILYSKYFQYYYFFIIILSTLSIIMTCFLECTNNYLLALEALIIIALIIEVTIRLLAQRKYFFYSFWNILDVIIISVCVWLYYFTTTQCPKNDSIIDNGILIVRYLIQFIRLGILLKKNKSSGTNDKRKSVNFSHIKRKSTYGTFNPSSSFSSHRKGKRRDIKAGENKIEEDGDGSYQNIINHDVYNPYGERYGSIDDSQNINLYGSIPNGSFISQNSNALLSQSLARDYAAFLQESNGSISVNIDSNANFARMFYQGEDISGSLDGKKMHHSLSVNSVNDEIYQKLIHKNIENNNRNSSSGLPNAAGIVGSGDIPSDSRPQPEKGFSNDSLSTNPIETPSSSLISPSSFSFLRKSSTLHLAQPPIPQKSGSSSIHTNSSLPPKISRKESRGIPTHHSSTFSEIPSKVNLLTPILYGSPGAFSTNRN